MSTQYEFTPHKVEEKSFEPLPPGRYRAQLIEHQPPRQSQKGNMTTSLTLLVFGPGYTRKVFANLTDTERAAWMTKSFMDAVGQDYNSGRLDLDAAKNVMFEVDLTIDDKPTIVNGNTYYNNKVTKYTPIKAVVDETPLPGGNVPTSDLPF